MDEWDIGSSPPPSSRETRPRADGTPSENTAATAAPTLAEGEAVPSGGAHTRGLPVPEEVAPRASRTRRRSAVLAARIAVALLLVAVGAVIGFAVARAQHDDISAELSSTREELGVLERALSQAEERNWNYYRENGALKAQLEAEEGGGSMPTTSSTAGQSGPAVYGDGIYLVGEDILPGTYDGVVSGTQGYWARLKATDGQVGSILANAVPRGPFVLTIVVSDRAVELRGVRITAR